MLQLNQYPQRIAALSNAVNELEGQLAHLKRSMTALEFAVDNEIFFDPALRNEKQRDCKRYEMLMSNDRYADYLADLTEMSKQKANALTALEQVRNAFSVAKLETRAAIAQQLVGSEFPDLVGV